MKSNIQRAFIWVIAITMIVGTLGAYFMVILANDNSNRLQQQAQDELTRQQAEQQAAKKPLPGFDVYKFNPADVTALQTEDVKVGEGKEVALGDTIQVNYAGNLPDGTLFDSNNINGELQATEFPLTEGSLIQGWTQGIPGMKEGGIRRLVIPADMAYGAAGSPPTIPPNTPLAFYVEVISAKPTPATPASE